MECSHSEEPTQLAPSGSLSLSNGSTAGSVVGLFANGVLTEYFGYRKTMIGALIALAAFIFLSFFAFNLGTLLAGQILCGLSWGVFSTLTTTYAAEIMPLTLRGYLTANTNLCWLIGQIIANGILRGLLPLEVNMVLPYPIWIAVGLDHIHPRWGVLCSRVTLVACEEGAHPRGQTSFASLDAPGSWVRC